MNQQQTKHIKDRLARATGRINTWKVDLKEPPEVKKARSVVAAWEDKLEAAVDAKRAKVKEAVSVVEEEIYFGDSAKSLAALKRFEKMKF